MSSRLSLAALLALAVSCAAPPPAEPPPAAPPIVTLPPAPPPSTTASAAPSAESNGPPPAPAEVLGQLGHHQRTDLAVLAAICQPAVALRNGKPIIGCTSCPSNSGPAPDAGVRLVPADGLVEPQAHVQGSFTARGADEHLLMMDSCSCNGCLDEAYLVRPAGAATFARHRLADVRASFDCKVVHRRGEVDRALCSRTLSRLGYTATVLELHDFSGLPDGQRRELTPVFEFMTAYNLALRCEPGAHFVRRSLERWELRDVDHDGEDDLVVDIDVGDGVVTPKVLAACSAEDASAPPKGGLPPMRSLELVWTATPAGFKPTAATAAHLKRLDAEQKKADP